MAKTNPYALVIARAWKDPAFKKKLLANPEATLKEIGFNIPAGVNVKVLEDSSKTFTLVLPKAPTNVKEMSDIELERIAGGNLSGAFCPNDTYPDCPVSTTKNHPCPPP